MIRKTLTAALTVAVLGTSAIVASTSASQAGYGYGYGHNWGHNYGYGYKCHYKRIKVWGHYGYYWKTIKVC